MVGALIWGGSILVGPDTESAFEELRILESYYAFIPSVLDDDR